MWWKKRKWPKRQLKALRVLAEAHHKNPLHPLTLCDWGSAYFSLGGICGPSFRLTRVDLESLGKAGVLLRQNSEFLPHTRWELRRCTRCKEAGIIKVVCCLDKDKPLEPGALWLCPRCIMEAFY